MKLSTATKVGILFLIGAVALAAMISWKSNIFLTRKGIEIRGSFPDIEGLSVGSDIRYRGFIVGRVMRVDPGPKDITIYGVVKRDILIPNNSYLRVGFDGIVGLKYLEIRPGTSEVYYKGEILKGISTAGIVDLVDIGTKNLIETEAILENVRKMVESPGFQSSISGTIINAEKVTENVNKLTEELRATNKGIMQITTDPQFQQNVKGTIKQTNYTLTSANTFFESVGKTNIKPSADVSYGSSANQVRGNLDIVQSEKDFFRIGIGEGPSRDLGVQDLLISRKASEALGMKLGMINSRLGGGLDLYLSPSWTLSSDLYDINNPKPNVPKFRLTSYNNIANYVDMLLQADDVFNSARNYSFGIRVRSQ